MRIGIDIDGILADFQPAYQELFVQVGGRDTWPYRPYYPTCWDYHPEGGYTDAECKAVWKQITASHTFWRDLAAHDEAESVINRLAGEAVIGHDVYFVTSRPGVYAKRQTENWLMQRHTDKHILHLPTVMISSKKGCSAAAVELEAYIDDKPENCIDVVSTMGTSCAVYLMNRSWNASFTDLRTIKRVSSVHTMLDELGLK